MVAFRLSLDTTTCASTACSRYQLCLNKCDYSKCTSSFDDIIFITKIYQKLENTRTYTFEVRMTAVQQADTSAKSNVDNYDEHVLRTNIKDKL